MKRFMTVMLAMSAVFACAPAVADNTSAMTPTAAAPLDKTPFIDEVDTNKDGCLSHEEWTAAGAPESSYQGLKDENGCARFTNRPPPPGLDANGDGKLTLQEMKDFDKRIQAAKAAAAAQPKKTPP